MKLNFQQKLIASFLVVFAVLAACIVFFEQQQGRRYKTEALRERLDAYADQVSQYLSANGPAAPVDTLLQIMPPNLRLTLVDGSGAVVYDNAGVQPGQMENHAGRPEIASARAGGSGTDIRMSASVAKPYLYYAKDNGGTLLVRVALPYDIRVRSFLKPDNAFLYFAVLLFLAGFFFIWYLSRYFGRSVKNLRDFSLALEQQPDEVAIPKFSDDEFGQVAARLAEDFKKISENERRIAQEREKLLQHIQTSAEGVCFFNRDRTVEFYNGLFMQYYQMLAGTMPAVGQQIPDDTVFRNASEFLDNPGTDNYYETRLQKQGREFVLRLNIFEDRSYEIILTDITAREKNRRLKQEMTGNIAHELRTPVTSIRGFLEIVLGNELDEHKAREYMERAYAQTKTLSELIADMSLLTRIDERQDNFSFSDVDMNALLEKVQQDTASGLSGKNISLVTDIPQGVTVHGNESLLYSVFRNLTDNVVHHAGEGVTIGVRVAGIKGGMVRFSFTDNGRGIADGQDLARLFERFYRVDEGRTRETGGSGLGLSIVKNAVRLHGGEISVRPATPHGLEFTILLPGKRKPGDSIAI